MSLLCRLGFHRWPEPSGVGYCQREGCGALMRYRSNGRTWIRHVEPPSGPMPRGLPPKPAPPPPPPTRGVGDIARPAPQRVEIHIYHHHPKPHDET